MGAIHFSINSELAGILANELKIKHFVETGTYNGDSLASLKGLFATFNTVELSNDLYGKAVERFKNDPSVACHLGDSAKQLKHIIKKIGDESVMFWLDAHWCAGENTAGAESQCPLLDEIAAVNSLHEHSVLWIDDARYFTAPPPTPLISKGWPTFQQVLDALRRASEHHELIIADDTLLFVPVKVAGSVREYLHAYGADWLAIAHNSKWFPKAVEGRDTVMAELEHKKSYISQLEKNFWIRLGDKLGFYKIFKQR